MFLASGLCQKPINVNMGTVSSPSHAAVGQKPVVKQGGWKELREQGWREGTQQRERCLSPVVDAVLEALLLHPSRAKKSPEFLFHALPCPHPAL